MATTSPARPLAPTQRSAAEVFESRRWWALIVLCAAQFIVIVGGGRGGGRPRSPGLDSLAPANVANRRRTSRRPALMSAAFACPVTDETQRVAWRSRLVRFLIRPIHLPLEAGLDEVQCAGRSNDRNHVGENRGQRHCRGEGDEASRRLRGNRRLWVNQPHQPELDSGIGDTR